MQTIRGKIKGILNRSEESVTTEQKLKIFKRYYNIDIDTALKVQRDPVTRNNRLKV